MPDTRHLPGYLFKSSFQIHALLYSNPCLWSLLFIMFSAIGRVVVLFSKCMCLSYFLTWIVITQFFYIPILCSCSYYSLTTIVSNLHIETCIHGKAWEVKGFWSISRGKLIQESGTGSEVKKESLWSWYTLPLTLSSHLSTSNLCSFSNGLIWPTFLILKINGLRHNFK